MIGMGFGGLVSVPFRGFRGLQEEIFSLWAVDTGGVSVRFRGFRGLQDVHQVPGRGCWGRFSPLPGF